MEKSQESVAGSAHLAARGSLTAEMRGARSKKALKNQKNSKKST
jgi:hypothetical protein